MAHACSGRYHIFTFVSILLWLSRVVSPIASCIPTSRCFKLSGLVRYRMCCEGVWMDGGTYAGPRTVGLCCWLSYVGYPSVAPAACLWNSGIGAMIAIPGAFNMIDVSG